MKYKIFSRKSIYGPAKIEEVTGYPAAKPFFVAKQGKWGVYEEQSGLRVGGVSKTKAEAMEQANRIIKTVNPEAFKKAIDLGIKDREEFEKSLDK